MKNVFYLRHGKEGLGWLVRAQTIIGRYKEVLGFSCGSTQPTRTICRDLEVAPTGKGIERIVGFTKKKADTQSVIEGRYSFTSIM